MQPQRRPYRIWGLPESPFTWADPEKQMQVIHLSTIRDYNAKTTKSSYTRGFTISDRFVIAFEIDDAYVQLKLEPVHSSNADDNVLLPQSVSTTWRCVPYFLTLRSESCSKATSELGKSDIDYLGSFLVSIPRKSVSLCSMVMDFVKDGTHGNFPF